jgi:DUF4097 and DUF4098 domain-containing protein YvlB
VCVRYPPDAARGCDERGSGRDGNGNDNDTTVDFDVTLPHGAGLAAHTVNGSVDAVGDGAVDAATVNGSVTVEGRDVRSARTVNGSVTVRILDRGRGTLSAHTVNGSIDVALPAGTGVDLHASTMTGDINAAGVSVERPRYGPGARAAAVLGDGTRTLDLKTLNGSITVRR